MVFESVISQILNKVLGEFVENLDGNQLNIGIWGGDVNLKDLVLKASALETLDLPIQTVYGKIGNLVLKVPWTSIYTKPTIIMVEDVYLLAEPNQQVAYDPVKGEKRLLESKKKEIEKIENAKKAEKEKDLTPEDPTLVQKIIQQVIKNAQVYIKNIHIRYEDKVTQPGKPFAIGVTLAELVIESTDSDWKKAIVEEVSKIYKVVQLEGLAVYWNCNSKLYAGKTPSQLVDVMKKDIANKKHHPAGYRYILGPITAGARLRMNPNPMADAKPYSIPVYHLNLDMGNLFIGISKAQYRDIIALADSMDRMAKGEPYRKFRPNLTTYKGHYKEWWHFAYKCVVEGEVKRRRRNWDWNHMVQHKLTKTEYRRLLSKNFSNTCTAEERCQIEECEKKLDLISIVIIRQRVELEWEREIQLKKSESKGWFSGWWGSSKTQIDATDNARNLLKQFEKEMTPEEKSRLYKAIDYQENASPTVFPEEFVDKSLSFLLRSLELELRDDKQKAKVIFTSLKGVKAKLETRASASSLKVHVAIDNLKMDGLVQDDFHPTLIIPEEKEIKGVKSLLDVTFETNPLDKKCDQRIHLVAKPLKIVYDAVTINKVLDIFKIPPDSSLDQIQAAASSKLTDVKQMTSTGLQYAIEQHTRLDVDLILHAPYIIIPYNGKYEEFGNVLVIDLGQIKIHSSGERSSVMDVRRLYQEGLAQEEIFEKMKSFSYDHFAMELTDLQILVAQGEENWKQYIVNSASTEMHLLNPLSLNIQYSKCLITDDPRLPHQIIKCELPSVAMSVSDARLTLAMALVFSIPLPESDSLPQPELKRRTFSGSTSSLLAWQGPRGSLPIKSPPIKESAQAIDNVQFKLMEVSIRLSEICFTINQQELVTSAINELAKFKVTQIEAQLLQSTYETNMNLLLGSVNLTQNRNANVIDIISTPIPVDSDHCLIKVNFTQVDPKSPDLHATHHSCESSLGVDFSVLNITLHQEGLLSLMAFSQSVMDTLNEIMSTKRRQDSIQSAGDTRGHKYTRNMSIISETSEFLEKGSKKIIPKKKRNIVVETIKFKLTAQLQEVMVKICTDNLNISSFAVRGLNTDIFVKESYTQMVVKLSELVILDLNPETKHNLILTTEDENALSAQVVLNNLEVDSKKPDIDVNVKMGGTKIVFVNWFVTNLLNFLNQFQAAQQAILEASEAAAQKAKENAKEMYQKATKISLNIRLRAPKILVPVSSQKMDALLLDLGVISISNKFLVMDTKNEDGYPAVVDDMKVALTDFKQSKVTLDPKENILQEWSLLEPINFELRIKRNLSSTWYKAVPDIDISGRIKLIDLHISQADYCLIMSVLSENLQEGKSNEVVVSATAPEPQLSATSMLSRTTESTIEDESATNLVEATTDPVTVFLKFTFTMEELLLNLYSKGFKNNEKSTPSKKADNHLARFSLKGLSVKGRLLSDQSIVASVLLVNCLLDDMRKGREDKLNRLIERTGIDDSVSVASSDSGSAHRGMIDVTYQQTQNDMFADVRIFSFTLILSVEYLMKIAEFFTNPDDVSQAPVTRRNAQKSSTSLGNKPSKISQVSSSGPPTSVQMTLNLKVEKPDIVLVEHMDSIDSKAMILNSEILVKFRMNGDHQVVNGLIKDLQLYTCNYNPATRAETRGNVLHPVTISLAGSTPEGKGLHLELVVEEVLLRVSPATIELLNSVLVTMSQNPTVTEGEEEEQFIFEALWNQKPFRDNEFWFLKSEEAAEVREDDVLDDVVPSKPVLQELCIISMPSIVITVEAGVANKTLPFLLFETSLKGSARNWSSQLGVEATVTLLMGYYNSRLALWEPLIEPVENRRGDKLSFEPWELRLEMSMNEPDDSLNLTSPITERGEEPDTTSNPPVMSIDVISDKTLELTVTKTCLEVLTNLGKAFASAIKQEDVSTSILAPYRVLNEIGEDITLLLEESSFKIAEGGSLEDINKFAAVPLVLKNPPSSAIQLGKELNRHEQESNYFLQVKVNKTNCVLNLPVIRADKRFFMLNYAKDNNNWGLISDVKVDNGVTTITLRSTLQVYNHFSVPIDVYYMTKRGNELELVGSVAPNGTLNLPLKSVYTPTSELFFGVAGYSVTTGPYIWKELQTDMSIVKILQCPIAVSAENTGTSPFLIKAIGEMEQVYYENTSRHTMASTCYNIHLRPAAIFKNFLPLKTIVCVDELAEEIEVEAGGTLQLPNVNPGKSVLVIRLPEYLEKEWSCRKETEQEPGEFEVWTFHSYDSPAKMSLDLGVHTINKDGSFIYSLYCPFWMLNKTGLMIGYRASDENLNVLHHPANFKGPILFSFNARNFFGKKKASIRVESGDWSNKFSLDVAGSSGVVQCKANDRVYQIGVHNQLTYNNLTKQVTFTPYYVIINDAPYAIECQESDRPADHWIQIEPKSCTALWPKSELEDKLLKLRICGTDEISAPFLYTESHTTLLKLNNKYGGVNVDIQLNEGAVYISLAPYTIGCAPALIINHTSHTFNFWEKESVQIRTLQPKTKVLYTWENPSGPRLLVWEKGHKIEIENDLRKDACGNFHLSEQCEVYWSSFLDGMQRVLLFTQSKVLAQDALNLFEIIQQEITLSLHGFGLSLVNNMNRQEVMYIGIASSGVIWEMCKLNRKRYKPLDLKESVHIERAYQQFLSRQNSSDSSSSVIGPILVDNKIEVDFEALQMYKPRKRKIRRTFQTGVWLNMKTSPSQMQLHAKINRVQIDNQMFDCIFPVVLAPVPPPKSVAADSGIKPFIELSIVQLLVKNSQIRQFKYFSVLVQEFHIKVDMGFINAVVDMMQESENSDEEDRLLFVKDMQLVDEALYSHAAGQAMQEQKSFYDLLHLSPLKIHISFSLAAGTSSGQSASTPNFLNVLLQGVGVTLTDLQDVVFKLAPFKREYIFLTQKQLVSETSGHYVGQLVKQLYVLVLGLDVIGNPYGLVVGISKGVEDLFYEPFQGAIQGPSEFAEGLALGVRSLVGHTVGGVMGAATRITGAMGKGIAALTFDEDFQRKRRDQMNKKPTTAQEGIARSGKGLVMGVVDGFTGVFTKPVTGAKEQGVEGFFKGLGKGAVGLVTRPAAGLVDFASGSLDVVKRATEVSDNDTARLRPPRFLQADGLVRPYNSMEAEGNKLLVELNKGKYATTDVYVYHRVIIEKRDILLLTDKRMAYITHNDIFGGWQIEWSYTWQELVNPAKVVPKGVLITTNDKKKKLFGSNDNTKIVLIGDPAVKEELCAKIEELRST
ncbi:intermembrane lipid transfer protein Vps13 isoform X2 [Anthonomus grandis grandis]|uniref:intermembrane lipid transfer protein Vps13 isoform X2 n=1 Tax=Anthonomus grandis grandis TaxID=2921223 RepID=UPI002165619E|nr:intermembrane lipid transfer protein Vps13 isoform X2 [Anthonomus grandis grandis]